MNELIAKLYNQAIVIEDGGDYVAGELDPAKFAELIVRECAQVARSHLLENADRSYLVHRKILENFGV
jgi:hypothetical protein